MVNCLEDGSLPNLAIFPMVFENIECVESTPSSMSFSNLGKKYKQLSKIVVKKEA